MKSFREYITLIEDAQQPVAEAIPVIKGTPKTNNSKYAKLLASIAKERQEWITNPIGLPKSKEQKIRDQKEGALYAKAAELFAAGDIDGGSKIITQNIPPQHQDYFRHFMEEYKIPTNLVFGDVERNFPAPKQDAGAFNGDAKLEKKIRDRLEQLHSSETMEPEEVYDQVADEFGISTELLDQWLSGEDDDEYYKESADPDAVKRIEQLVKYK